MRWQAVPCYVVDKITGQVVSEHPTIISAARSLGRDYTVSKQVNRKRMLDRCRYTIRKVEDYDPHEEFDLKHPRSVPVVAVFGNFEKVEIYNDVRAAAKGLNYSVSAVHGRVKGMKGIDTYINIAYMPRMGACNEMIKRGFAEVCD